MVMLQLRYSLVETGPGNPCQVGPSRMVCRSGLLRAGELLILLRLLCGRGHALLVL